MVFSVTSGQVTNRTRLLLRTMSVPVTLLQLMFMLMPMSPWLPVWATSCGLAGVQGTCCCQSHPNLKAGSYTQNKYVDQVKLLPEDIHVCVRDPAAAGSGLNTVTQVSTRAYIEAWDLG